MRRLLVHILALALAGGASAQSLVPAGATWAYRKGVSEPPVAWRDAGFDDSSWSRGAAGFGYGDGDDATVLADMQGAYASVALRHRFVVADPAVIAGLQLVVDYDDGFVAYLNGVEVARRGLRGDPVPHDATSWDHEAGEPEIVPLSDAAALLVAGANVLAIQAHDSSLSSSDFSIHPELQALAHDPASRGPYLQAATPDSVVIRWRTRLPSSSRVEFGDPSLLDRVVEDLERVTDHEIALAGLRPGTRYGYRVLGDGRPRSGILTFWTLPRPASSGLDLAVLGNSGTGEAPAHAVARRVRELRPELVLHAGDAVFPDGRDEHWDAQVFAPLREAIAGAALHPAAGEVDRAGGAAWDGNVTTFANGPAGERSYSYDAGSLHVAVIDAGATLTAGSPQWTWLAGDLAGSLACWKAVVIHEPLVTGTAEYLDPAVTALRDALAPLFESTGVDLVLTSHVGAYERSFPIQAGAPAMQASDPTYADPPPIYVVTGGGGRPLQPVSPGGLIAAASSGFHFVRIEVLPDRLVVSARDRAGTVLDTAMITKACAPDADGDGVPNASDDCPYAANPGQENADGDAWGDACEPDADGDGVPDDADGCPRAPDAGGGDLDADGRGDACDADDDGDAVPDTGDACPRTPDPAQLDADRDGLGDACDDDDDGDTIPDAADNCPLSSNLNQTDIDGDGEGNACDADDDGDGVDDAADNCRFVRNPGQQDLDGDGEGDHCDSDDDGDGIGDVLDVCPRAADPLQEDSDGDGRGDACESDADGDGVLVADDCDDGNPSVGSVPAPVQRLRLRRSSGGIRLTWNAPRFDGEQAQLATGTIAELWADRGPERATCEGTFAGTTTVMPRPAEDRWWLARFTNGCDRGPYEQPALDAASPCP